MPFWQPLKRCETCRFFVQDDPSNPEGYCSWEPTGGPNWLVDLEGDSNVSYDDGEDCDAFRYDKHKPHPLDQARGYLARAQVGDTIGMRTYSIGAVSRTRAKVMRHARTFAVVEMFNRHVRVRYEPTNRGQRAGTVIEMEDWGVDPAATIGTPSLMRGEHPERALDMLRRVRAGDKVPLIGYPPLDNQRRTATILSYDANKLTLRIGRRKVVMYRRGALAGIIEGDVWTLDTTEAGDGPQAPSDGPEDSQGHAQI